MIAIADVAIEADIQYATRTLPVPTAELFCRWVRTIKHPIRATVCIRIVDDVEMTDLNERFRKMCKATNVLAFEGEGEEIDGHLGDVVICAPQVMREAKEYGCQPEARFAHMTVHGLLHLLGYNHDESEGAERMEAQERCVLRELGYPDPYQMPS